jgi:hypothetical protein
VLKSCCIRTWIPESGGGRIRRLKTNEAFASPKFVVKSWRKLYHRDLEYSRMVSSRNLETKRKYNHWLATILDLSPVNLV